METCPHLFFEAKHLSSFQPKLKKKIETPDSPEPSESEEDEPGKRKGATGAKEAVGPAQDMLVNRNYSLYLNMFPFSFASFDGAKPQQEYINLKKFGDSLLTRSTKCSDLIGMLENEMSGKTDSPDAQRASRLTAMDAYILFKCAYLVLFRDS